MSSRRYQAQSPPRTNRYAAVTPDGGERRDREALERRRPRVGVEFDDETTDPTDLTRFEMENNPVVKELWDRISSVKHGGKGGDVQTELTEIKATLRLAKWLLGFVIAAVLGSVVVIATKIFSWGYGSGEINNRIHYLEKVVEGMQKKEQKVQP